MQLIWHVRAAQLPRRLVDRRRKVAAGSTTFPPPDRSGAVPPVGHSQFPRALCRVNRAALAVGTLAAAGACSKVANAGSCHPGPKLVIAARLVKKLRVAGGAGMPVNASRLPPTARNAAENRPDAIGAVSGSDQLLPSRRRQTYDVRADFPGHRVADISRIRATTARLNNRVGQRPAKISEESCGLPCRRPGCYVLFLPSPRSPDQKFCSGSCRQALRRVRQREARLRQRRRRGILARYIHHRGPPQHPHLMSSRIEDATL